MNKEFKKGDALRAADLQDMANAISACEAGLAQVLPPVGGGKHGQAGLAYYNVRPEEVQECHEAVTGNTLEAAGTVRKLRYVPELRAGKINAGDAQLPAPSLIDWDGQYHAGTDGAAVLPVMAKAVRDVAGNEWPLADLSAGAWQAATVASCTLPDGTPLALRVHTTRGGTCLCFELSAGGYYGYSS